MLEQNFNRTILFGCLFEVTINKVGQQERTAHVVIAATYRNNTKILLLIQGIFNDTRHYQGIISIDTWIIKRPMLFSLSA